MRSNGNIGSNSIDAAAIRSRDEQKRAAKLPRVPPPKSLRKCVLIDNDCTLHKYSLQLPLNGRKLPNMQRQLPKNNSQEKEMISIVKNLLKCQQKEYMDFHLHTFLFVYIQLLEQRKLFRYLTSFFIPFLFPNILIQLPAQCSVNNNKASGPYFGRENAQEDVMGQTVSFVPHVRRPNKKEEKKISQRLYEQEAITVIFAEFCSQLSS